MANIKEIAKRAGVSVATVSRVLNSHPYVSQEKRDSVRRVIEEMDYTPNQIAIDLIKRRIKRIGVIIPYNNNQAYDQMLHGVLNESVHNNLSITVLPTKYNKKKELEYLSMLKNKTLDGLIITSRSNSWKSIIPYTAYGLIVSFEYTEHPEIGCSYMDRYASYLEVFREFKNKGHDQVAFTTARKESRSTQQTVKAYEEVFGRVQPGLHVPDCYSIEDGYRAGAKLIGLHDRPTAIFANGDEVAGGIYQYAMSQDIRVPQDLTIMGQENQPIGIALGLSTLDHQLIKVGEQAIQLMIHDPRQKLIIPYQIIHR